MHQFHQLVAHHRRACLAEQQGRSLRRQAQEAGPGIRECRLHAGHHVLPGDQLAARDSVLHLLRVGLLLGEPGALGVQVQIVGRTAALPGSQRLNACLQDRPEGDAATGMRRQPPVALAPQDDPLGDAHGAGQLPGGDGLRERG